MVFAKNKRLNYLAKVGIGLNDFRTLRQELQNNQFINSYGYEWMWKNDFEGAGTKNVAWNENIVEKSFVLGFITNYKISKKVTLNFSATSRMGGGDKWVTKLSNNVEMFTFYSLGTTINLGKN